jgi:hypothetical protein
MRSSPWCGGTFGRLLLLPIPDLIAQPGSGTMYAVSGSDQPPQRPRDAASPRRPIDRDEGIGRFFTRARWVVGAILLVVALIEFALGRWAQAALYLVLAVALPLTLGRARYQDAVVRRIERRRSKVTRADDSGS